MINHIEHSVSNQSSEESQITWEQVRELLYEQKTRINQAIREYPLPITACDDQFNYLLEKRSKITQEVGRFARLLEAEGTVAEGTVAAESKKLAAFIEASEFID